MRLQSAAAIIMAFAAQLAMISSIPLSRSVVIPGQVPVLPRDDGKCVVLPEDHYCVQEGRNHAYLPNFRGHETLDEALEEFDDYRRLGLLGTGCSTRIGTLLCFHYFPLCRNLTSSRNSVLTPRIRLTSVGPCAVTCETSRLECERFFGMAGLPWPPHLECTLDEFHPADGVCVDGPMDPYPQTDTRKPDVQGSGSGSGSGEPGDIQVPCSSLAAPANGQLTERGLSAGSETTYKCDDGYLLRGDHSRICQHDGTWSGEAPTCDEILCSDLQSPANGQVQLTGLSVGSEATYECNDGYVLRGDHSRTCQDYGTWSGEAPTCTYDCVCPGECKIRERCTANTFVRNDYTFAAHVRIQRELPGDNRAFSVHVERQYLPLGEGSPQLETNSTIYTTDCCDVCGRELNVVDGREYLFAGYYDTHRWYLDTQDSLVTQWNPKIRKNLEKWIRRRPH